MEDVVVKRWTAKRKSALVIEIIQGKPTVAEARRSYDLSFFEIEGWVENARRGTHVPCLLAQVPLWTRPKEDRSKNGQVTHE